MSEFKRESLNQKIGLMLNCFEDLNSIMQEYDVKFYEYFEDVRGNFIKILNEIVDSYVYKKPGLVEEGELHEKWQVAEKQNVFLKQNFQALEDQNNDLKNANNQLANDLQTREIQMKKMEDHINFLQADLKKLQESHLDNGSKAEKQPVHRASFGIQVDIQNTVKQEVPEETGKRPKFIPETVPQDMPEENYYARREEEQAKQESNYSLPPVNPIRPAVKEESEDEQPKKEAFNVNNFIANNNQEASKDKRRSSYNFDTIQNKAISNERLLQWNNNKELSQLISNVNHKQLTLKQLKELIVEIYEAKSTFDEHCVKENKPKDTLEQYMFRHFKNKYGLNNMVVSWTFSLLNGIKKYSTKDNDVTVFGLVI